MKKLIAIFIPLLILATVISGAAFSTNAYSEGFLRGLTISGRDIEEGVDYSLESDYNNVITILSDKEMNISGISTGETRIEVSSLKGANLTFSNLEIALSVTNTEPAFKVKPEVDGEKVSDDVEVKITLEGTNVLKSGTGRAGLENNGVKLIIDGEGTLKSYGRYGGAGIGGGKGKPGKNITINGGTIIAEGITGAGIGGGENGAGENIKITGGNVTAKGFCTKFSEDINTYLNDTYDQGGGSGIGGGMNGSGSGITIEGGKVNATGYKGAGIGGGAFGNGTDITISGGIVEALSTNINGTYSSTHNGGAGIGGGFNGNGENIIIKGSAVIEKAEGAAYGGAGIGGGRGGSCKTVKILDEAKIILAQGGANGGGAGIGGGGDGGDGTDITINGSGEITAIGGSSGAGIGGGSRDTYVQKGGSGNNITISGSGKITATGGSSGAGIGGGSCGGGNIINISGSVKITAKGGNGAGIGGGSCADGTQITIAIDEPNIKIDIENPETINQTVLDTLNAYVIATGGSGAGIGGGDSGGSGRTIIIESGYIKATGDTGAGIGGGQAYYNQSGKAAGTGIEIKGGYIVAEGSSGAGIGGGYHGEGEITIIGGHINATSTQSGGAGIGGGAYNNGTITINGGKIIAVGSLNGIQGPGGAGIGGGYGGSGTITINDCEKINATGGAYGATGIGGGYGGSGAITINGGNNITATGGQNGGVGIGGKGSSTVTMSSGEITAIGTDDAPGISGTTVTLGNVGSDTEESTYPLIHTNEIDGLTEGESNSDLAIVFGLDGKVGTVHGGTVHLTNETNLGESCEMLIVMAKATLATEGFTLDNGITLYLKAGATLDKYNKMTIKSGKIVHEDKSRYVPDDTEQTVYASGDNVEKWVCDICGTEEPHNWGTEFVYKLDANGESTHHWHKCKPGTDCSTHEYQIETCSITEDSKKEGYAPHRYDFNADPEYGEDGKLHYYCLDCNYELIMDIPVVYLIKENEKGEPLEGAKFEIYSDETCTTKVTSAITAKDAAKGNKAVISYQTVPGKTFYIKEIAAPEGYEKSDKVYKAEVGTDGKVTYSIVGSTGTLTGIPICENAKSSNADPTVPPVVTPPVVTPPVVTPPTDTSSADTSSADTSPADTSPADTSPADTSPADTSPADTSSADTSPANTAPTDTPPGGTANPETGVAFSVAGFAILSGVICATYLAKGSRSRRKRKNNDKIDF